MSRPRAAWAVMLAAAAVLTLTGCPDTGNGKADTATCQAAKKQAAEDPGNTYKQKKRREACG